MLDLGSVRLSIHTAQIADLAQHGRRRRGWRDAGADGVDRGGRPVGPAAATLFLIVFLWQFPHFMAIAWIYRADYAAAGCRMLSVVDPTGRRAGWQAVLGALVLLPVSVLPASGDWPGLVILWRPSLLGLLQFGRGHSVRLALDERSARMLLRASLIYLPSVLVFLLLSCSDRALKISEKRCKRPVICRTTGSQTPLTGTLQHLKLQYQPGLPLPNGKLIHVAVLVDRDHVLRRLDRRVHRAFASVRRDWPATHDVHLSEPMARSTPSC